MHRARARVCGVCACVRDACTSVRAREVELKKRKKSGGLEICRRVVVFLTRTRLGEEKRAKRRVSRRSE